MYLVWFAETLIMDRPVQDASFTIISSHVTIVCCKLNKKFQILGTGTESK